MGSDRRRADSGAGRQKRPAVPIKMFNFDQFSAEGFAPLMLGWD